MTKKSVSVQIHRREHMHSQVQFITKNKIFSCQILFADLQLSSSSEFSSNGAEFPVNDLAQIFPPPVGKKSDHEEL